MFEFLGYPEKKGIKNNMTDQKESDLLKSDEWLEPDLLALICEGSFGKVYEAKNHPELVIKIIKGKHNPYKNIYKNIYKNYEYENNIQSHQNDDYLSDTHLLYQEDLNGLMETHPKLLKITQSHPNLLPIQEVVYKAILNEHWIIMPKLGGMDLFDYLNDNFFKAKSFPTEGFILDVIKQVLEALEHLHQNGIIHRDVKTENMRILPSYEGRSQIILFDYGLSEFITTQSKRLAGTAEYIAPEICFRKKYDYKVDIWALGITTFFMMTSTTPVEKFKLPLYQYNFYNDPTPIIELFNAIKYSKKIIDLCMSMLIVDAEKRISLDELIDKYKHN